MCVCVCVCVCVGGGVEEIPRNEVVNVLDCNIIVDEFELQSYRGVLEG